MFGCENVDILEVLDWGKMKRTEEQLSATFARKIKLQVGACGLRGGGLVLGHEGHLSR